MTRTVRSPGRPLQASGLWVALLFFLALAIGAAVPCRADDKAADAILGIWEVAEKDAHIEIYRQDNRYFGRICWLRENGEKKPDAQESKMYEIPKVGTLIVRGFRFNGIDWRDGTLYDPTDGKSYKGIIRLDAKGRLLVRGYLGISLLGRTTVWRRVE